MVIRCEAERSTAAVESRNEKRHRVTVPFLMPPRPRKPILGNPYLINLAIGPFFLGPADLFALAEIPAALAAVARFDHHMVYRAVQHAAFFI